MIFRPLKADEIECRIGSVGAKGFTMLLYKDARCDMNILDETVGEFNWQRDHKEIKGTIYCGVGIFHGSIEQIGQGVNPWVWKWDAGSESYTEKEKGEASDSFKRACVNWGIGRELYSAPFIWIPADKCNLFNKSGRMSCNDRFEVTSIGYDNNGNINHLTIKNMKTRSVVYSMGAAGYPSDEAMKRDCESYYRGDNLKNMLAYFGADSIANLSKSALMKAWDQMQKGR